MNKIAIFASGNGSNAENIISFFKEHKQIKVELVASNNPVAKVLKRAEKHGVKKIHFQKDELYNGSVLSKLRLYKINFIVLAGFLLKIPESIIKQYTKKIINIHPSLLPLHGGKGMYGLHVHKSVFDAKDTHTGITIHYVNKSYDKGAIIFQAKCPLKKNIKLKQIQKKVHEMEIRFFPKIIESLLNEDN